MQIAYAKGLGSVSSINWTDGFEAMVRAHLFSIRDSHSQIVLMRTVDILREQTRRGLRSGDWIPMRSTEVQRKAVWPYQTGTLSDTFRLPILEAFLARWNIPRCLIFCSPVIIIVFNRPQALTFSLHLE